MYLSSIQTHTGCISRILASICAILRQSSSAASTSAHLASLRDPVLRARCIARCISRSTLLSRAMPAVDNRCWMHARVKAPLFGGLTSMTRMAGKNLSRKKSSFLRFRFLLFCGAYFVFCKNLFLVQNSFKHRNPCRCPVCIFCVSTRISIWTCDSVVRSIFRAQDDDIHNKSRI